MVKLTINGKATDIDATPDTPLLYVLRDHLGMNGAKYGCGLGQCGACTVLVDDAPVFSCVVPNAVLEGRKIVTLEGLGTPEDPAAIQRAFVEEQAAQCGYCTAGMIVRAQALLLRSKRPSEDEIREHMATNLCRCGTHNRIVKAVRRAARYMRTSASGSSGRT